MLRWVDSPDNRNGRLVVDGHLQVHVEQLGAQLEGRAVVVEVADVEAPQDGPLDLGSALPSDLIGVGVFPGVDVGAGKAAVAVEQAGCVGDRTPAIEVVLGGDGQGDTDVLAPVPTGGISGPGARHHQRRAGGHSVAQRLVRAEVGGVRQPEVVAVDDEQPGVRQDGPGARRVRTRRSRYWRPAAHRGGGPMSTSGPPHVAHSPTPSAPCLGLGCGEDPVQRFVVAVGDRRRRSHPATRSRLTRRLSPER